MNKYIYFLMNSMKVFLLEFFSRLFMMFKIQSNVQIIYFIFFQWFFQLNEIQIHELWRNWYSYRYKWDFKTLIFIDNLLLYKSLNTKDMKLHMVSLCLYLYS